MTGNADSIIRATALAGALLLACAAFAEETADPDALEPAVDTSTLEPAVDTSALPPAADTPPVTADVRRREIGDRVMDEMDLGRTEITGNQELPKVLYIVPWQKSNPGELMGRPVNTLLDEVLAPIDREEFIRQVDYYGDLHDEDAE